MGVVSWGVECLRLLSSKRAGHRPLAVQALRCSHACGRLLRELNPSLGLALFSFHCLQELGGEFISPLRIVLLSNLGCDLSPGPYGVCAIDHTDIPPWDSGTLMLLSGLGQASKNAALVKWSVQEPDGEQKNRCR